LVGEKKEDAIRIQTIAIAYTPRMDMSTLEILSDKV
jgi:hypothetical protein